METSKTECSRTFGMRIVMLFGSIVLCAVQNDLANAQLFGNRSIGQPLQRQPAPIGLANAQVGGSGNGPGTSGLAEAGSLLGNERFLRKNRRATDFVGSDQSEANTFVGAGQVLQGGRVQAAVESLQDPPDLSTQINRPWTGSAPGRPYPPNLQIEFASLDMSRFWDDRQPKSPILISAAGQSEMLVENRRPGTDGNNGGLTRNRENQFSEQANQALSDFTAPNLALTARVSRSGVDQVQVFVSGRTATLRGLVSDLHQSQIAELLLQFEPGISTVVNEIRVAQ